MRSKAPVERCLSLANRLSNRSILWLIVKLPMVIGNDTLAALGE